MGSKKNRDLTQTRIMFCHSICFHHFQDMPLNPFDDALSRVWTGGSQRLQHLDARRISSLIFIWESLTSSFSAYCKGSKSLLPMHEMLAPIGRQCKQKQALGGWTEKWDQKRALKKYEGFKNHSKLTRHHHGQFCYQHHNWWSFP